MAAKIVKRKPKLTDVIEPDRLKLAMEKFQHDVTASALFLAKQYSEFSGRNACDFDESDIDAAMKMPSMKYSMPISWLYDVRKVQP